MSSQSVDIAIITLNPRVSDVEEQANPKGPST